MNVLVIGSGGREHALAWKLAASPRVTEVLVAPGNAGTANEAGCRNVELAVDDIDGLVRLAIGEGVALTVVGPEVPLVAGLVDRFREEGLHVFGPSAAAAQLEGSKAFAKDFLARHRIPTAGYAVFTEVEPALAYLHSRGAPIVVKADGLAAGKGVVVAQSVDEAVAAIDMVFGSLGAAGAEVVIEEFLRGEEASFFALCDGEHVLPLASAQDHKRAFDGDQGPNTGGMGTYSPAPVFTPAHEAFTMARIVRPTLSAMAAMGAPFRGILFVGLMIGPEGPKLIEFNARFGDPECQSLMVRLESDLLEGMLAALDGRLDTWAPLWSPDAAVTVVMATKGYPGTYPKGTVIEGTERATALPGIHLFHATTARDAAGHLTAQGGRTLSLTARAATLAQARAQAYAAARLITWPEGFYRTDIAAKAMEA
ncbi:MAG TPA: phosphoribosylamine--glycine ligase [Xanthomonadales bacterium]|nr:phosphoribosylamine--glycine ligase [Xanthomonadales bacterium]